MGWNNCDIAATKKYLAIFNDVKKYSMRWYDYCVWELRVREFKPRLAVKRWPPLGGKRAIIATCHDDGARNTLQFRTIIIDSIFSNITNTKEIANKCICYGKVWFGLKWRGKRSVRATWSFVSPSFFPFCPRPRLSLSLPLSPPSFQFSQRIWPEWPEPKKFLYHRKLSQNVNEISFS